MRNIIIPIKFADDENKVVRDAAKEQGCSVSEYIRNVVLTENRMEDYRAQRSIRRLVREMQTSANKIDAGIDVDTEIGNYLEKGKKLCAWLSQ